MSSLLYAVAAVLVVNIAVALWRVAVADGTRDRLSGLLLLSTVGAAALIVLASATDQAALRDAAVAVVALAVLIVVVRVTSEGASRG